MYKFIILLFAYIFSSNFTYAFDNFDNPSEKFSFDSYQIDIPAPKKVRFTFENLPSDLIGENLFQYLHKRTEINKPLTYTLASNLLFSTIENFTCPDGNKGVYAFYSRICVNGESSEGEYYKENGDQNGDGYIDKDGMNVEHLWPQSFFNKNLPMRSDLHHLRPTFKHPNNVRATVPFGKVDSGAIYQLTSGAKFDGKTFEPPDQVKGDVARAMLYFVLRYYDRKIKPANYQDFFVNRIKTFLEWNRMDPPDEYEKERNERIYLYQGNRNPFIDDYTIADRIGEKVFASH